MVFVGCVCVSKCKGGCWAITIRLRIRCFFVAHLLQTVAEERVGRVGRNYALQCLGAELLRKCAEGTVRVRRGQGR